MSRSRGSVEKGRPGRFRKAFRLLAKFRADLREPLPGTEGLGSWARLRLRFRHLTRRYGWKVLALIFLYYLVRDTILYLVIPFLVARRILS